MRIQILAAFSALATVPLLENLPFFYLYLHQTHGGGWAELQVLRFALCALVMLAPTLALGAMFPVAAALLVDGLDQMGSRIGRAYAFNTWGAVLGSIAAGLVLVPLVGLQKTIVFGSLLNLAAGLAVCLLATEGVFIRRMATVIGSGIAMVGCIAVLKPWSPNILNSGVFLYAERYLTMEERVRGEIQEIEPSREIKSKDIWKLSMQQFDMLFHRAGAIATVAVMDAPDGVRFLTINGKTDASTGERSDMRTQVMIAQLPMLIHEQPDRVLVVGLGSGVTAGSALTHENALVDCVEIVPEVIEAARFFHHANNQALDNPRLHLIARDARNFLLTHDQKYDVIISQPSNPWIRGESSLFSAEWYSLVAQSLEEGGLFVQWLPSYQMAERDIQVIAHTLRHAFPHVTVWTSGAPGDLVLLAQKGAALQIDLARFLERAQHPAIAQDIARVGFSAEVLPFELFLMGEDDLVAYLYGDVSPPLRKNTDNWLKIEFSAPKRLSHENPVAFFSDPFLRQRSLETLPEIMKQESIRIFNDIYDDLFFKEDGTSTDGGVFGSNLVSEKINAAINLQCNVGRQMRSQP